MERGLVKSKPSLKVIILYGLLDPGYAVFEGGMGRQELGEGVVGFTTLVGFKTMEKVQHRLRLEARMRHVDRAVLVGVQLIPAPPAVHYDLRDRIHCQLGIIILVNLAEIGAGGGDHIDSGLGSSQPFNQLSPMPQRYVRDFMPDYPGQLIIILDILD
jgi:hypothetical protein